MPEARGGPVPDAFRQAPLLARLFRFAAADVRVAALCLGAPAIFAAPLLIAGIGGDDRQRAASLALCLLASAGTLLLDWTVALVSARRLQGRALSLGEDWRALTHAASLARQFGMAEERPRERRPVFLQAALLVERLDAEQALKWLNAVDRDFEEQERDNAALDGLCMVGVLAVALAVAAAAAALYALSPGGPDAWRWLLPRLAPAAAAGSYAVAVLYACPRVHAVAAYLRLTGGGLPDRLDAVLGPRPQAAPRAAKA